MTDPGHLHEQIEAASRQVKETWLKAAEQEGLTARSLSVKHVPALKAFLTELENPQPCPHLQSPQPVFCHLALGPTLYCFDCFLALMSEGRLENQYDCDFCGRVQDDHGLWNHRILIGPITLFFSVCDACDHDLKADC